MFRFVLCLLVCVTSSCARREEQLRSELIETRVPRAAAGDPGWDYRQRATADFDGDGASETAVLISDVLLDPQGRPLWEDGHRWQVYVEEPDGARTYLYARFLANGKLTAEVARAEGGAPTIALLEQTPQSIGVFEFSYQGPDRVTVVAELQRAIDSTTRFEGGTRP